MVLMKIYLGICVFVFPVMYLYQRDNGMETLSNAFINRFTLGNLGFAESLCYNQLNDDGNGAKNISCRTGRLKSNLTFAGLLSNEPLTNTTGSKVFHDYCGDPDKIKNSCSNSFDLNNLKIDYEKNCTNKIWCELDLQSYILPGIIGDSSCTKSNAIAYIQVQCEVDDVKEKRHLGL